MEQDKYIVFNCDLKIPEAGFGLIASSQVQICV